MGTIINAIAILIGGALGLLFRKRFPERIGVFGVGPRKPFDITNERPIDANGSYELWEPETSYEAVFRPENGDLRDENTFYPDKQKTPRSNREDECASVWSGCRPTGAVIRDHGLARGAPLGRYFLKINKLTWSDPGYGIGTE